MTTTTAYTVNINWPALHAAFQALDAARRTTDTLIGYDLVFDALGGSYAPWQYEEQGIRGGVRLLGALQKITEDAWQRVHGAAEKKRDADEVRAAVAVMLAAKRAYDLLAEAGICEAGAQVITRGNDGKYMHLTGLHWLAGVRTDRRVTVEQARAIVDGAEYRDVLSERDARHPDYSWM